MKTAIVTLEIALETLVTNEPINRKEGKDVQADLEAKGAAEIRQALAILRAADAGPVWPLPASDDPHAAAIFDLHRKRQGLA